MDRSSPIFVALVEQTIATIADQSQRIEMMEGGKLRVWSRNMERERDETAEWIVRLKEWKAENERLLTDLQEGRL